MPLLGASGCEWPQFQRGSLGQHQMDIAGTYSTYSINYHVITWIMDDHGNFPVTFLILLYYSQDMSLLELNGIIFISAGERTDRTHHQGGSSTRGACTGATQRVGPGKLGHLPRSQCGLCGPHPEGGTGGAQRRQRGSRVRGAQQG